jgi:ribosomal protein S18 acetylase RimI-like enzyme
VAARETITYGQIQKAELESAARIFVRSFPRRALRLFRVEAPAVAFYRDLFELMRLAHGKTFFAARKGGELVGYLILTVPEMSLLRAAWREGFPLRVAWRALSGRYGYSFSLVVAALKALCGGGSPPGERELLRAPHVYVVVVGRQDTGTGIGSALIDQARAACQGRYRRIWLYVEVENAQAVRLYERIGFRIVRSDAAQHAMVWDL